MARTIQGKLDAKGSRFAIVISRFNSFVSDRLLHGALDALERQGAAPDDITIVWVPGSFEIPIAAKKLAEMKKYDAIICLGAVIRGATPHFEYIAAEVTKGIAKLGLDYQMPVTYGIVTADSLEQAIERAGTKAGNKGWDAALSAIELSDLSKKISGKKK